MKLFVLNKVKGWEKIINSILKNETELELILRKTFFKFFVNAAFGKFLENVRSRLRLELNKREDIKNFNKHKSKLSFNGTHKSYENYDSYTIKQNKVVMDKAS